MDITPQALARPFSLICPNNDLESQTILRIAKDYELHIIQHPGLWGAKLDLGVIDFAQAELQTDLIIVELPNPIAEQQLIKKGHRLHIIDHHQYGDLDRASTLSSLEQFAKLMGHTLSQKEWYVAINDRSYIPGLFKAGCSFEEMLNIRSEERQILGVDSSLFNEAQEFWNNHRRELDDLIWCLAPDKFNRCLGEVAQFPTNDDEYRASIIPPPKPMLLIYHEEGYPDRYTQIALIGNNLLRDRVGELFINFSRFADFKTWSGGGDNNVFYGAQAVAGHPGPDWDALIEPLFASLLISGRPLIDYDCTLMLPLDLFLTEELGDKKETISKKLHTSNLQEIKLRKIEQIVDESLKKKKETETETETENKASPVTPEEQPEKSKLLEDEKLLAQAYEYFYPQIRDQVFQRTDDKSTDAKQGIAAYRLKKPKNRQAEEQWTMTLGAVGDYPDIKANIQDLILFQYYNGLYLLAIRLKPTGVMPSLPCQKQDSDWWKVLVHCDDDIFETVKSRQVEYWLHFTRLIRQLYPVFREQIDEDKYASITWSKGEGDTDACKKNDSKTNTSVYPSKVVLDLLGQFINIENYSLNRGHRLAQLNDDRMFVHVSYALAGKSPAATTQQYRQLRRLYSLALYVDRQSDGYGNFQGHAYDPEFLSKQLAIDSYDRWNANGTFMGFTSHSNVFMGVGYFFCNVISPEHVPVIYQRMAMVTQFYRATLLHFDRRITEATTDLIKNKSKAEQFRNLRGDFIKFTNNQWFPVLSPQMQGNEMSRHMHRALGLTEKYQLIKDEMERADEYLATLHDNKWAERAYWFGWYALVFAILSLAMGAAGLMGVGSKSTAPLLPDVTAEKVIKITAPEISKGKQELTVLEINKAKREITAPQKSQGKQANE
ncbi:MAG: hypothetical protein KUG79_16005 [Pseudomonadales bacterium]|nr:hypothetical protein [Pseudomonadales bacterium]